MRLPDLRSPDQMSGEIFFKSLRLIRATISGNSTVMADCVSHSTGNTGNLHQILKASG